jgi:hypothetical protein
VTAGGDVIGRDQVIGGNYTRTETSGLQGEDLARLTQLFQGVYAQVDRHAAQDADTDPSVLRDTARKVEEEAQKGAAADPDAIRRSLNTLARLAPDVLDTAVNALINPAAAVASGVKLVARAFQSDSA